MPPDDPVMCGWICAIPPQGWFPVGKHNCPPGQSCGPPLQDGVLNETDETDCNSDAP
jgi:hypothetical protein